MTALPCDGQTRMASRGSSGWLIAIPPTCNVMECRAAAPSGVAVLGWRRAWARSLGRVRRGDGDLMTGSRVDEGGCRRSGKRGSWEPKGFGRERIVYGPLNRLDLGFATELLPGSRQWERRAGLNDAMHPGTQASDVVVVGVDVHEWMGRLDNAGDVAHLGQMLHRCRRGQPRRIGDSRLPTPGAAEQHEEQLRNESAEEGTMPHRTRSVRHSNAARKSG
jgi:hypothetical protein